ncbi:type I restriction endonuclease subunit S [Methylomonas methanica]|uniref:Type I restriction endonuclease subunit S n=1 Tax=Methylomonas methanica TaxID=421 RepID=A0A177LV95_METMH|nr:restriction endonuclease subunit S [Methylomonas methanica]OAH97385.1 type I restriction endonuclease subunit S [Methylomonas methanica]
MTGRYKAYPEYKESGIEWLGNIPKHWSVSKIKYITTFQVGWTPPTKEDANFDGENLWANISDLRERVIHDTNKKISDHAAKVASMDITPKGSLLYSFKLSVGTVSFAGKDMYTNEAIASFLKESKLPLAYLYYVLPKFVIENASTNIYGARILNQELICNAHLLAPTVDEAQQIANFLDHETAKIDTLIEKQQQLIQLLKEKRQAVISHAVTKGLNPDAPMRDSGVEWLGEVPEHWTVCRLKQVIKSGSSISYGIVQPGDPLDEGVPFVQTTNISQGNFDLDQLQKTTEQIARAYPRSRLEGGEVILGIRASIGAAYVVPESLRGVNLSRGVARIVLTPNVSSHYLVLYFGSGAVERYWGLSKQGSTFSEVSIETVREITITIPPVDEQEIICNITKNKLDKIDKIIEKSLEQTSFFEERRSALISAAVTGKIDVRNWQPPKTNTTEAA